MIVIKDYDTKEVIVEVEEYDGTLIDMLVDCFFPKVEWNACKIFDENMRLVASDYPVNLMDAPVYYATEDFREGMIAEGEEPLTDSKADSLNSVGEIGALLMALLSGEDIVEL